MVFAVDELTTPTLLAVAAASPEEAEADALPDPPALDAGAEHVDDTDGFMTGDTGPLDGEYTLDCRRIRVTDSTRFDPNAHMAKSRLRARGRFHRCSSKPNTY